MNNRFIENQDQWGRVAKDLEGENLKLKSYDETILRILGDVSGKKILDYGAGPGVLALALQKLGAQSYVYDLVEEMYALSAQKIGDANVYREVKEIPRNMFDIIVCNLVVCIVEEEEVENIITNIKNELKPGGKAYIGFCNPLIFNIPESNLDIRHPTEHGYCDNHTYKKTKKEGGYEIIEIHRPVEWYEELFEKVGLPLSQKYFTPEYSLHGNNINDFIIMELEKKED